MWSWLIIVLISLTCIFCFISVVQLELKKSSARIWIILTCCFAIGVVAVILNIPSRSMNKYSYEPKTPQIEIKELIAPEENTPLIDPEETVGKKVVVIASELYVRAESDANAQVLGSVGYGQILNVLNAPADIDWINIQADSGLTGWVVKSFVEFLPEEPVPEEAEQQEDGINF